ncbi:hypothetical protein [Paenibacillus sp. E194]|nr:hypothetical protein [Paenibacillus sp. E194]
MKEELMKKSYEELQVILEKDLQEVELVFPVLEFLKMKDEVLAHI